MRHCGTGTASRSPTLSQCRSSPLFACFLTAYLVEKGKNSATKEDVGRITAEVESAKALFSERLEHLRADLSSRAHYGKLQYEREMGVFETIWPRLCALRDAVLSLRPIMDSNTKQGETKELRMAGRIEVFKKAYEDLLTAVESSRPFYAPAIWKELKDLLTLC